jgi:hypothetical protein
MKCIAALLGIAFLTAGCANKVPFTQDMRQEHNLSVDNLKIVQFYIDDDVTLQRELSLKETSVTPGHALKILNDKRIEEVFIKGGTPGVVIDGGADNLLVSFEEGKALDFRVWLGNRYMLRHEDCRLKYDGMDYIAVGKSKFVCLLVVLNDLNKIKKESRTLPGRTLK